MSQLSVFSDVLEAAEHLDAEAGITTQQLSDFLAGDRTLRSDVLDRLTAAVGASLIVAERK